MRKNRASDNKSRKYSFRLTEEQHIRFERMLWRAGLEHNRSRFIFGANREVIINVPCGQGRPHEATLHRPAERVHRPDFPRGEQLQSGRQGDQHVPLAQHAAPPDRHAGSLHARIEISFGAGVGADQTIAGGVADNSN